MGEDGRIIEWSQWTELLFASEQRNQLRQRWTQGRQRTLSVSSDDQAMDQSQPSLSAPLEQGSVAGGRGGQT